jgi:hypothetical protein
MRGKKGGEYVGCPVTSRVFARPNGAVFARPKCRCGWKGVHQGAGTALAGKAWEESGTGGDLREWFTVSSGRGHT